jgi:hypothetical protein
MACRNLDFCTIGKIAMNKTQESGCHAILEFVGDRLDPAEVRQLISLTPIRALAKGDLLTKARSENQTARARVGFCGFSSIHHIISDDPNDHISFLLHQVAKRRSTIVAMLKAKSLTCNIVCISHGDRNYNGTVTSENLAIASVMGVEILFQKEFQGVTFVEDTTSPDRGDSDRTPPVQKS